MIDPTLARLAAIREYLASAEYAAERAAVAAEPEPDRSSLPPPPPAQVARLTHATGDARTVALARLKPLDPLARGLLIQAEEAEARSSSSARAKK